MNETTFASIRDSFLEGKFSDITVQVKRKLFHLHRLILWGIPYFRSLLEGQWKDSTANLLTVEVDDPMVTAESFEAVARALYHHPIELTHDALESIYATASFLQVEDICSECVDFIIKSLTMDNVVPYTCFALTYEYLGKERLLLGCSKFLWINGSNLRGWLPKLPVRYLCELFKSNSFWVASEFCRFSLIVEIFEAKLGLPGKDTAVDGMGHSTDEPIGSSQRQKRRCTEDLPSTTGGELANESETLIRGALEHILCHSVHYEHLSLKQTNVVSSKIEELKMPSAVMKALLKGRVQKEALQTFVQVVNRTTVIEPSVCSTDTEEELRSFRFGVELENALDMGADSSWESKRFFFGGSQWWLLVRRRKNPGTSQPYGVYLRRASGDVDKHLYSDKRKEVGVEVEVICGKKSMKFHKGDYVADWGCPLFIFENEVGSNVTPEGALRFMVILQLLF